MDTVTCDYCGLPFKTRTRAPGAGARAREHYCCTGCAMLAHVPVDEKGQFPVNAHLVSALAAGFLYFNELLFWLLAELLARQGRGPLAERFLWIGAVAALVTWASVAFVQWHARSMRGGDYVMLALAPAVHAWMLGVAFSAGAAPRAWPMALANAALIAWSLRGVWRGRRARGAK